MLIKKTVEDFVLETASNSPAPGGGSVSALAGAQAAALISMMANLTKDEAVQAVSNDLKPHIDFFLDAVDKDTEAFNGVMKAFGMPKSTDEEKKARSAKIQEEYKVAANVPFEVGMHTLELLPIAEEILAKGNPNSVTDLGVGLLNLRIAMIGAFYNVKINLTAIKDEDYKNEKRGTMEKALKEMNDRVEKMLNKLEESF